MIGTRVGKIGRESTNYDQMDIRRLIKNKSHLQIPSLYLYLIYFLITEVNLKTLWSKLCQWTIDRNLNWESDWPQAGCRGSPGPSEQPVPSHWRSDVERVCRWNIQSRHLDRLLQCPPCRVDEVEQISSYKMITNTESSLETKTYSSNWSWSCGSLRLSPVLLLLNMLLSSSKTECLSVVQGTSTRTWRQKSKEEVSRSAEKWFKFPVKKH